MQSTDGGLGDAAVAAVHAAARAVRGFAVVRAEGTGAPVAGEDTGADGEVLLSFSIMLMLVLLGLTVAVAYMIQRTGIKVIHETLVAIILGAVVGMAMHLARIEKLEELTQFNADLFYFLLLPPIIFNSGYDLKRRPFFANLVGILTFAFFGTTIATFVTGGLLYALTLAGVDAGYMPLIDCLIFGALISATDPVTVLAIFHAMHVDPKIFALVFGESIMNDAIAIVLFQTLIKFEHMNVTFDSVMAAFGGFLGIFFGSFAIGTLMGCFAALLFKHIRLYEYPGLEATTFVIIAYISFLLAQGVGTSGIVSMLFCGISMAHYAFYNMSLKTQQTTKYMFQLISFMAENFVFSYVGLTIFTNYNLVYKPAFIICSFLVILVARACNIVPLSFLLNIFQKDRSLRLTVKHQTMLWWSGLRGALAFMLATKATGESAGVILSTTLVLVVATVAIFGSSTRVMLEKLDIPIGVVDEEDEDQRVMSPAELANAHWSVRINRLYIEPFLMNPKPPSLRAEANGHGAIAPSSSGSDDARPSLLQRNTGQTRSQFVLNTEADDLADVSARYSAATDAEYEMDVRATYSSDMKGGDEEIVPI